MKWVVAVSVLFICAYPAHAENVVNTPLRCVDSKLIHWYLPMGKKNYQYETADYKLIWLSQKPKELEVPDKRTYEKRHPIEVFGQRVCGLGNLIRVCL